MRVFRATALLATVLIAPFPCVAGEAFRFRDDFSRYAAGSDGSPSWATEGIDWKTADGRFVGFAYARDLAFPAKAPHAKRVAVEATMVVRKAAGKQWKTAGLAVAADERNYWALSLVEGPDKEGNRHYVELCEMLRGVWLSQSEPATRLSQTDSRGTQFNWRYGRPYHLRLEMAPSVIRGTVADADGRELARIGFKFDNKAVTAGRPALSVNFFQAAFDDVAVQCEQPVPAPEKQAWTFPPYTRAGRVALPADPKGKATGLFHVEQHGERWWAIDPKGRPFFFIGTDHANWRVHWCEKLGYAPYHRNLVKLFGGDEHKWAASTAERLVTWGFNTLGANHSQSLRGRGLAWTGFPNVFHPEFPAWCDRVARRGCARYKDDPWLVGYFLDNELEWYGKEHREWSLVDEVFKKPAGHSGKQALMGFLKKRYPKIEQLNAAWGTAVASYEALAKATEPLRHKTERGLKDKLDFLRLIADKYFAITTAAVRRHDPNHMVLGCRFAGRMPAFGALACRRGRSGRGDR